jgi:hypothetical protein
MELVVFSSGINTLVHVARQTVDTADQHAAEGAEKQRQTLGQRSQLDRVLSSSSVLDPRSSSNVVDTTAQIRSPEASMEYFIGTSARLAYGDVRKDLDTLKDRLDVLKRTKESLLARMAGADQAVLNGISDELAAVDVAIKEILIQIQAIEGAERNETDSSNGRDDQRSGIEAQLEKTAQAYEDLLHSNWP